MKNSAWVLSLLSNALVATLHAANRPTAPSGHFTRRPRLYRFRSFRFLRRSRSTVGRGGRSAETAPSEPSPATFPRCRGRFAAKTARAFSAAPPAGSGG